MMSSPSQHRYLLTSKYGVVVDQLVPEELLSHLIQNGVLSIEEAEMVEDTRGGMTARARKLIALVYRKPDDKLPVFIQCLRNADHGHVADLLEGEGESYVELRLSVRDDSELENLDKEFSALSCEDQSTPDSLDEVDSAVYGPDQACPPPFKCTCRSVEDTIRESILVASGEMQKCMIQRKLDEWKSYEATINNCIVWLQELRKMGCSLCQVKTGCVILRVRCSKLGLDFLWHGVSSGQFSRELAAIFRDLYAEMKGITIQIDVTINPVENGSVCAQMTDAATAIACSDDAMEVTSFEPQASHHGRDFHGHDFERRLEEIGAEPHKRHKRTQCVVQ